MKYSGHDRVKFSAALLGLMALGGLGACSALPQSYPSVSDINRVTEKLLTPNERKKAIEDMSLENAKHRDAAVETIKKQ